MADALVDGAFLSAPLLLLFDRMASQEVVEFIRGNKLNEGQMKKLKPALISVNALWDSAEEKQFFDVNVRRWLAELKDVVYDAEDLLDEIATEASARSKTLKKVASSYFYSLIFKNPFKQGIESKLEDILRRLESLFDQRDALNLSQSKGERAIQRLHPTSLVDDDEFGVFGRDGDKETIMEYLMNPQFASGNQIGVIPIVGMGGLGKTTLARLIYNDVRVKEWFDIKLWVRVSEDFDALKIAQVILQEIRVRYEKSETLNQLRNKLKETLSGKKFLFVLDDVQNENDLEYLMIKLFNFEAKSSKIIATTRDESVGRIRRDAATYHLKVLTDDDCWKLIAKRAFGNANTSLYPNLKLIGEEIAKRCKGLPLAAATLGGLLGCCELSSGKWDKILCSNLWREDAEGNILPPLRLSYYYLPSHLKRCFAYCSIFPKDYKIEKEVLVRLWMAEGLLAHSNGSGDIEKRGIKWFNDLVSRSFFQQLSGDESCFVMHDLISDLAKFISGEFVCRLEGSGGFCGISNTTRHLSNIQQEYHVLKKLETLSKAKSLRTFLTLESSSTYCYVGSQFMHHLIEKCRCLRVLSLVRCENIKELPEEICNLKHLRHLNMSRTRIKSLPNSLCTLYNLQALILFRCGSLVELPKDMRRLINMHYLDLRGTHLTTMPEGMGELKDLRMLTDFAIGRHYGSSVNELGKMKNLRGRLAISGLENAKDAKIEAKFKDKRMLTELELKWSIDHDTYDTKRDREVLEQLEPHTKLESLVIGFYGGLTFPEWVGHSSFSNVVSMELSDCRYCIFLPPLGQLSSLKSLSIKGLEGVKTVGDEFYGHHDVSFGSLESLTFFGMPQWVEWFVPREAFFHLQKLCIINCPELSKSLPEHLPCLTKLEIENCGNLGGSLPMAPSISEFSLCGCNTLQLVPFFGGVQRLKIILHSDISVSILEHMIQHCTHLEDLTLWGCCNLKSLPQATLPITLKRLRIQRCDTLDYSKMLFYTSLETLEIVDDRKRRCDIPQPVEECFPLPSFPMLNRLNIHGWQGLKSIGALAGSHHNLTSLSISFCHNLICFQVEEGLSATNLTSLSLSYCLNLKSLPEQMQSLFPSLEYLSLSDCPEIESFPKEGLPPKLKSITICSSDKLIRGMVKREWSLQTLHLLTNFEISSLGSRSAGIEMKCFPYEHLLPSSLIVLSIYSLPNLKVLDDKGFRHLTSLREMYISGCPKLQSMPEKGSLTSLSRLSISYCPLLEERFAKEKGKDWTNISHIPVIEFDDEVIV